MEYLPDDFVIRQMRAEYKKQAFLDDVLHPYVVSIENGYVICLQDEAGNLMYQWNFRDSNPMLSEQERTWN